LEVLSLIYFYLNQDRPLEEEHEEVVKIVSLLDQDYFSTLLVVNNLFRGRLSLHVRHVWKNSEEEI